MKLGIVFLSATLVLVSGCSTIDAVIRTPEKVFTTQRSSTITTQNTSVSVPVVNITIQQGTTTKQQIMSQLGQPDRYINSRQGDFMSYDIYNSSRIINLTYIEKSGSRFSYVMSQAGNTKNGMTIGINTLNNTVGSINIY